MDVDEEHVKTLMSMGFPSESEIRRALRHAKSDLGEAVGILTNDHPVSSFDTIDDDVEMKDIHPRPAQPQGPVEFGPQLPPSYNDVIQEVGTYYWLQSTVNLNKLTLLKLQI